MKKKTLRQMGRQFEYVSEVRIRQRDTVHPDERCSRKQLYIIAPIFRSFVT